MRGQKVQKVPKVPKGTPPIGCVRPDGFLTQYRSTGWYKRSKRYTFWTGQLDTLHVREFIDADRSLTIKPEQKMGFHQLLSIFDVCDLCVVPYEDSISLSMNDANISDERE